jgi:hypothetical protein
MNRLLAALVSAILGASILTGCTGPTVGIWDKALKNADPATIGYITGSLTESTAGPRPSAVALEVCDARGEMVIRLASLMNNMWNGRIPDIKDEDAVGLSFDLPVPQGTYYFCDVEFSFVGAMSSQRFSAKQKFGIPFEVKAGTVSYLGELRAMPVWGRSLIGFRVPGGGYWLISDRRERDMPLIYAKNKELTPFPVMDAVAAVDSYRVPFMRSTPLPKPEW